MSFRKPSRAIFSLVSRPSEDGDDRNMPDNLLQQFIRDYDASDKSCSIEEFILTEFSSYARLHPEIFGRHWRFVNMDFKYPKQ
jgi:hypothetical protein